MQYLYFKNLFIADQNSKSIGCNVKLGNVENVLDLLKKRPKASTYHQSLSLRLEKNLNLDPNPNPKQIDIDNRSREETK